MNLIDLNWHASFPFSRVDGRELFAQVLVQESSIGIEARSADVPTRYRFWKLNPFNLSQAVLESVTSS